MPNDVHLAIEGNKESFIQEIALNGQETWIQPLSMSEKLQRATQKIDFFKELEDDKKVDDDKKDKDELQENPWEAVRKNIVEALTEVRVLHDVLAVLRFVKLPFLNGRQITCYVATTRLSSHLTNRYQGKFSQCQTSHSTKFWLFQVLSNSQL